MSQIAEEASLLVVSFFALACFYAILTVLGIVRYC